MKETDQALLHRLGQGLVSVAPWVDALLLIIGFMFINGRLLVEPGVAVTLPAATEVSAEPAAMTAVVRAIRGTETGETDEIIYFSDQRFSLGDQTKVEALRNEMRRSVRAASRPTLAVHADRLVQHGTLVTLYDLARSAGVEKVVLLTRVDDEDGQ